MVDKILGLEILIKTVFQSMQSCFSAFGNSFYISQTTTKFSIQNSLPSTDQLRNLTPGKIYTVNYTETLK